MDEAILKNDLLRVLERHRGASQAIQVGDLVLALGLDLTSTHERMVRRWKRELVDEGHLIASSCGKCPGYFVPVRKEEMAEPLRNYKARLKSLAVLIASIEGAAALQGLWGQLQLELEGTVRTV
jgi:hypothetical protein